MRRWKRKELVGRKPLPVGRVICKEEVWDMNVKSLVVFSLLFLCALTVASQRFEAAGSLEQLNQYVAELQNNPGDLELREKIIKLALEFG